jgi:SNF1-activating kinase 1
MMTDPDAEDNGAAAMVSSSSAEDFASNMSQSASHPSIPSVGSGATSISGGDGGQHGWYASAWEKDGGGSGSGGGDHHSPGMSDIFRTTETITPETFHQSAAHAHGHSHDHDHDHDHADDDDEGLMISHKLSVKRSLSHRG